ncbi:CotH kinase family protein, partial [Rickettsiales bacterium]|nr:CotH kinase family protein [Rickettsiales bacterium]
MKEPLAPPRSSLHSVGWELIKPIQKFFFQVFNKDLNMEGLPQVHLYIPEKSLSNLQADLPYSSKVWQPGYLTYPNNSIKEIQIKNRGDNVRNYVFDKKSWRIKTKKKSLLNGYRNWHYVVPRGRSFLAEVISSKVSNHLGLLNADRRLVELFINSESAGILVESKRYDETWLRKQNLMPVDIYKLETNKNKIQKILQTSNSIQNPSHWNDKRAFNNRTTKKDFLLENTLDKINKSVVYSNYSANHINFQFPETTQIKEIIRRIVSLDAHASTLLFEKSSLFMISDDQSGHVTILPKDPRSEYVGIDFNNDTKINNVIKRFMLDCNQIQLCLSMEDSKFRHRMLSHLYQYIIYEDILNKLSDELLKIRDALKISLKRDFARIDLLTNLKEKVDLTFKPTTNLQNFDKVISNID